MSVLEIQGLNQFYGDVSTCGMWSRATGSCTVQVGRNGVGKTNLLKAVRGLIAIRSGSIHYAGQELAG